MKKFIGMAAAVVLAGATASAGITGEFRTTYTSSTEDDGTTETKDGGFGVDWARVAWSGMAGEGVSYNARFDLINADAAKVEYAYITRKFSDSLSLRAGVLDTLQGAYEGELYDNELYLRSSFGNWLLDNQAGVGLDYTMGDHAVTLEVFNTAEETGGTNDSQTMTTVGYTGKFGNVGAKLTYTTGSAQGFDANGVASLDATSFADDATYEVLTVGANLGMVPGWDIAIDYSKASITEGDSSAINATNQGLDESGFVIAAKMTEGMYRGVVKYYMTEILSYPTLGTENTIDSTGMSLALEVVPGGEDFRYFVGYNMTELKAATTTETTQMFAGLTLNTDFLK